MPDDLISRPILSGLDALIKRNRTARKPRVNDRVNVVPSALWGLPIPPGCDLIAALVAQVNDQGVNLVLFIPGLSPPLNVAGVPHDEDKNPGTWHFVD